MVPAVNKVLEQLAQENPGVQFRPAYDNARFVNILFANVWHELGLAILLSVFLLATYQDITRLPFMTR